MLLKEWAKKYRTQEDIDMFKMLYKEIMKDDLNPLEFTINRINYFIGKTDTVELDNNLKKYGFKFNNDIERNAYEIFSNFETELMCSLLHYFSNETEEKAQEKFDNAMKPYKNFLKKIKKFEEDEYFQRREYNKEFDGDIVITDPCYISVIDKNFKPELVGDTIYGDWSCTIYNTDNNQKIGTFCADSGNVCIVDLNEIKNKEKFLEWLKNHSHCGTIIHKFKGKASLIYDVEEYESNIDHKIHKDLYCYIKTFGNINCISKQTGF